MRKFLALFLLASATLCLLDEVAATLAVPESQKRDIVIPGKNGNDVKITVLNDKVAPKTVARPTLRTATRPALKTPFRPARKAMAKKARKQGDYSYANFANSIQNIPSCTEDLPTLDELADMTNYVAELGNIFPEGDTLQADAGYMNLVFCSLAKFYAISDQIIKQEEASQGGSESGDPNGSQPQPIDVGEGQPNGDEPGDDQPNGDQPNGDNSGSGSFGDEPNPDYVPDTDPNQTGGSPDETGEQVPGDQTNNNIRDPLLETYPAGYATPNDDGGFTIYKPDGTTEVVNVDYFDENPDAPYTIVYQGGSRVVRKAAKINLRTFHFSRRNSIRNQRQAGQFRNIFRHSL